MSGWVNVPSAAARLALNELDLLDGVTRPAKAIGVAMANVDIALATPIEGMAAGRCLLAAAHLIRAAELLMEQDVPGGEAPSGQVAGDAGSDMASAMPSPPAATAEGSSQ